MIAAAHSPARHAAALRKLGLAQQLGSIAFVRADDALAATPPQGQHDDDQQQHTAPLQRLLLIVLAAARQLLAAVAAAPSAEGSQPHHLAQHDHEREQQQQQRQQAVTVVLDSLPALSALFPGQQQLAAFLHCCRALGEAAGAPGSYRFAALAADDAPGDAALLAALRHGADAVAALTAVEGRTADLDGRLEVTLRRVAWRGKGGGSSGGDGGPAAAAGGVAALGADGGPGALSRPGGCTWHFRSGDVGVRWLSERIDERDLMA
jgi:hypothetical protein